MVVRGHPSLSLTRQCRLLSIGRSSLYDRPKGESAETLALMRRIDALFLKYPFYGARQMVRHLRREGVRIGRRRAARLMRLLGLQAVYRAPRTSAPHLGHRVYPYLLRGLAIERPNHVWCADITYIPVRRGFLYLVAIMDWASRCVLAWRLSNTLDAGFCVEALDEALARHGTPQIFNTDQGSQFTGFAFTARLREAGIRISMDGRGRCMDNIFIERLWRSLKYEAVYLHEIADGFAARRVIGQWIGFYNTERPHSALGGRTPAEAYRGDTPVDMMDKPLRALTTYPQAQQQQQKDRSKRILAAQTSTGIHLENAVSLSDKPTPPQKPVEIFLDPAGNTIRLILEIYETQFSAFSDMVKDFVRNMIFPRVSDLVPTATRQGAEAFLKSIHRTREVFEYEASDLESLTSLWKDYMSGRLSFQQAAERSGKVATRSYQVVDTAASGEVASQNRTGRQGVFRRVTEECG